MRGRLDPKMAEKLPKEKIQELKEMILERSPEEPVEKVLVNFCERHGVSVNACKKYYERMLKNGEIKEK